MQELNFEGCKVRRVERLADTYYNHEKGKITVVIAPKGSGLKPLKLRQNSGSFVLFLHGRTELV